MKTILFALIFSMMASLAQAQRVWDWLQFGMSPEQAADRYETNVVSVDEHRTMATIPHSFSGQFVGPGESVGLLFVNDGLVEVTVDFIFNTERDMLAAYHLWRGVFDGMFGDRFLTRHEIGKWDGRIIARVDLQEIDGQERKLRLVFTHPGYEQHIDRYGDDDGSLSHFFWIHQR